MTLLERLEGIEIRELMPNELKDLQNIVYNNRNVDYVYKPDPRMPHAQTWAADFINPKGREGGITIIVLGHKRWSEHYPLLSLSGKTLIGYVSVKFFSYTRKEFIVCPYQEHKKIKFQITIDRIYIFPPFRGNFGLLGKLLTHLEDTLRKYGYGNIELKPDPFFIRFLERRGYSKCHRDSNILDRYGKLL